MLFDTPRGLQVSQYVVPLQSYVWFIIGLICDMCVSVMIHWWSRKPSQKEINSQTDLYLVYLSSKTCIFEDKLSISQLD